MSFDGIMLRAALAEMAATARGGRVDRIYQPEPLVVTLRVRVRGASPAAEAGADAAGSADARGEVTILISCHPRFARAHLTFRPRENPPSTPPFCMLLRKHLEGGRIADLIQEGLERVLRLGVDAWDEEGRPCRRWLVAELMGKHSNLILLAEDGSIVDALKRVPAAVNRHREVLPGRIYVPPPPQAKLPLSALTAPEAGGLAALASLAARGEGEPAWRRLVATVEGLGPVNAREVLARAALDPEAPLPGRDAELERLARELAALASQVEQGRFRPTRVRDAFSALPLTASLEGAVAYASAGKLLDDVYGELEAAERFREERHRLAQCVATHLARARARLHAQEEERREAAGADEYRIAGELLMAQMHLVRPGQTEVRVVDYYDPDQRERVIALDPRLAPAANAQQYFKRYQKAKRALALVEEKVARTAAEIAYLESVENGLYQAVTPEDLADIRAELEEAGYLARPADERRRKGTKPSAPGHAAPRARPLAFTSSDGYTILVGKNNRQNDHLTGRLAAPGDLWLHAKDIPGAHVIVRLEGKAAPGTIPPRTLEEAATLAAYFSKARLSSKVPVDYTWRRNVRKPRGARPGMVVYTEHRTVYVTPDAALVSRLAADPAASPSEP